jgi:hypothetical protein
VEAGAGSAAMIGLAALLLAASMSTSFTSTTTSMVRGDDEEVATPVMVDLKLELEGRTIEHPGHVAYTGEETVLEMREGDRAHLVAITLDKADGGKLRAKVKYKLGGRQLVAGESTVKPKTWFTVKGKNPKPAVTIRLDLEIKRKDGVDLPPGQDPLDGAK